MRRLAAVLGVVLFAACAGRPSVAPAPAPRLVVLIVVDQLPSWAFERARPSFRGGFARLLRDGAYVRAAELPYANPFTATGHATIGTGAPPNVHGVIGNSWFRRDEQQVRPAEYDPDGLAFAVGPSLGGALTTDDAASSRALRVDGIADVLRRATLDRARSVSIALKARAAAFMAGRHPELAIWYEEAAGGMTTSHGFARELPAWLGDHARSHPVQRFFSASWEPLDGALLARETGIPDDAPGEGSVHGLERTFPHRLADSDAPARAVLHTPYGDEIVMETALAALTAMELGADEIPDLLAISFSARDYAGHLWGPDSWEALDLTLRLDRALGKLFDELDRRLGRAGWAVVLTSDHGATPVVERSATSGGRRITSAEISAAVEQVLARRLGAGPWVSQVVSGNIYLSAAFERVGGEARADALTAAAHAIRQLPGIAAAERVDQLLGQPPGQRPGQPPGQPPGKPSGGAPADACDARSGLERAICLSLVDGQSGELYVVPEAGSLISDYRTGTHHDAPFDDNRQVPILVMAPGLAPQAGTGSLLQVAPTLAALLRVPAPEAATQRPLFGLRAR